MYPFTYKYVALNEKLPIMKQNLHIFFFVIGRVECTSHEGSIVLSCKTSLKLNMIHPCSNLDQVPDCSSLIYSNAYYPMKRESKKSMRGKICYSVCERKSSCSR